MTDIATMSPAELAALLFFHADAGVDWLVEDDPIDRIAAFAAARAAPPTMRDAQPSPPPLPQKEAAAPAARRGGGEDAKLAGARRMAVAVPDEQAIADARFAAQAAQTLPELREAMEAFTGCNLKNSARSLVFAEGDPALGLMIVGPAPTGEDDREGRPFTGKHGEMLERMLAAIGLGREAVLLTHIIPWRPPGNRVPSAREMEICRPFIERQIALARPRFILAMGNFAARFFFGGQDTIHETRGHWRRVAAGGHETQTLATLHPQDLLSAPICKRLAWEDLCMVKAALSGAEVMDRTPTA
ncbi:uracil-DNA glycosylase [Rhizobium sp. YIM 134829]|uniref:uracil-DNA glycosylase n=1 Tax=Rhizobium sp. YIM 134829 TaxID=3390453 RepID=UPI00397D7614